LENVATGYILFIYIKVQSLSSPTSFAQKQLCENDQRKPASSEASLECALKVKPISI